MAQTGMSSSKAHGVSATFESQTALHSRDWRKMEAQKRKMAINHRGTQHWLFREMVILCPDCDQDYCANGFGGLTRAINSLGCRMLEILMMTMLGFAGGALLGMGDDDDEGQPTGPNTEDASDEAGQEGSQFAQGSGNMLEDLAALPGNGDDIATGSDADDVLRGHRGADALSGGAGDDLLYGNKDNDTLTGGTGDDTLRGGNDDDLLYGEDGDDSLFGGHGDDVLLGGAGNNLLRGGDGHDDITGGTGNDSILGGTGNDTLRAGEGHDTLFGNRGDDVLFGNYETGSSTDIYGGQGNDSITDSTGDSDIYGGAGDDSIRTGHGANQVHGGHGDDTIIDGRDTDIIYGGAGADNITVTGSATQGEVDHAYGGKGDDIIHQRGLTETYGGEGADHFSTYVNTWVTDASTIMDFTPGEDTLEIELEGHDYKDIDDFDVQVQDFKDGTGASVIVDGVEIIKVIGGQGMTVNDLQLNVVWASG